MFVVVFIFCFTFRTTKMNSRNDSEASSSTAQTVPSPTEPIVQSESWSQTKWTIYKIVHTWTIENFNAFLDSNTTEFIQVFSPKFSHHLNEKYKFYLKLCPKGENEENKEYISLFLHNSIEENNDIRAHFKMALLDENEKHCRTVESRIKVSKGTGWGWSKFVSRSTVLDSKNGLLPDDTLTVYCELCLYANRFNVTSTNSFSSSCTNKVKYSIKLSTDLESLLEGGKHSDVTLSIGSSNFSAHKAILSARSPVFAAMFEHKDTEENIQNCVEIIDIPADVLQQLLQYIYSGRCPEQKHLTAELLSASDKYQINELKTACEESLSANLDVESVAALFVLSDMHNAAKLKWNCIEYITAHATEVMLTDSWEQMFKTRPELALQTYRDLAIKTHPIIEKQLKKSTAIVENKTE